MGTFGYEPKDGDGPFDLLYGIERAAVALVVKAYAAPLPRNKAHEPHARWNRIGLVQIVVEKNGWHVPLTLAKDVLADLVVLAANKDWIANWRDPKQAQRVHDLLVADLSERIACYERLEAGYAKLRKGSRLRSRNAKGRLRFNKRRLPPPELDTLFSVTEEGRFNKNGVKALRAWAAHQRRNPLAPRRRGI